MVTIIIIVAIVTVNVIASVVVTVAARKHEVDQRR